MSCGLGLDLAPTLCGFCVGDGRSTPYAAAWILKDHGPRLGALFCEFEDHLEALYRDWPFEWVCQEAPINPRRWDKLWTLRRTYGLGAVVERWCFRRGIPLIEADVRRVKAALSGHAGAGKPDMVAAARRAGVELPKTKEAGREDAADGLGCWTVGMKDFDPATWAKWDAMLWRQRGALL